MWLRKDLSKESCENRRHRCEWFILAAVHFMKDLSGTAMLLRNRYVPG